MLEKRFQEDASESKNEYSGHREVEKAFFEKGVYELLGSREYRIVQEGKIKGKRFDGLAISEIDSKDNIFAVKWWHNYRNMEAIGSACRRLNAAKKSYEEVTNRECEARIVIITLRIFEDRMKKWVDDIPRKIDTYGFKIQVMAEEDL